MQLDVIGDAKGVLSNLDGVDPKLAGAIDDLIDGVKNPATKGLKTPLKYLVRNVLFLRQEGKCRSYVW